MRTNTAHNPAAARTHEGAIAARITPEQLLRRSVLACMLFEDEFYEDGLTVAERIKATVPQVPVSAVAILALEARGQFNLRHVPLYLTALLAGDPRAQGTSLVSDTLFGVIQRADELAEFLAIYAKVNGVTPDKVKPKLSNQVRKGLARAFGRFNAYQLAKYDRAGAVRLRDVMNLVHPKPSAPEHAATWKALLDSTLAAPDTWEVSLSGGADKRETFERLLREGKLGYLALLRNLRNMAEAGVDERLVIEAILARKGGAERVLPFRYLAAARAAPQFEPALDIAMGTAINEGASLPGRTVVLVDVSGSMNHKLSAKSDLTRMDAACALAAMVQGDAVRVFSFSEALGQIAPRRGMAMVDAIRHSQPHGGTRLFEAVNHVNAQASHDRLIVITDEQATANGFGGAHGLPYPVCERAYIINVASARHGVGYGKWTHLDGFSEQVLRWIVESEAA